MTTLFITATPIGNMGDMTYRAVETLKNVDLILCEDTRVTGKLLKHYEIETRMLSYHANSNLSRTESILEQLEQGMDMALVSDAGTPTISDPGVQLIQKIVESDLEVDVVSVPGASAITAAMSVAGLAGNQFIFMGFLPHKKGRQTIFNEILNSERPVVFYESPHRIMKTLDSLTEVLESDRQVVICRELTKIYEQTVRGKSAEVAQYFKENEAKVRGEFVVIVDGK